MSKHNLGPNLSTVVAKKEFGQNFLHNKHYLDLIAAECMQYGRNILEIGPGTGNLTRAMLALEGKILAIEKDKDLENHLGQIQEDYPNFLYQIEDITNFDWVNSNFDSVVGNLPYHIGTKILLDCLKNKINNMVFLLQKEVVDRIVAQPNTSDYGSLSVIVQAYYDVKSPLQIPPSAFYPPPKVYSKLLVCTKKIDFNVDYENLSTLLKYAFHAPRKKLKNNLEKIWPEANRYLDLEKRPGNIEVSDYIKACVNFRIVNNKI